MMDNSFLEALGEADRAALAGRQELVRLQKGQLLIRPRQPVEQVYFPTTAFLAASMEFTPGAVIGLRLIGHDGAAGVLEGLTGGPATTRVVVQEDGAAVRIEARAFRQAAAASPALTLACLRLIHTEVRDAHREAACNAVHSLEQRVARWILMASAAGGDRLAITQQDLAAILGVQRTSISAAAARLKARGVIDYLRGRLSLVDRPALEAVACDCLRADCPDPGRGPAMAGD